MNTHEPDHNLDSSLADPPPALPESRPTSTPSAGDVSELERQVEYIVDDCFFTVGQVVGMRTTVDYDAVVWWRDHYRAKFLAAMKAFGNRWLEDRINVTGVAIMLGERAVRHSEGRCSIDCDAARKAAADVERYCELHSRRRARSLGPDASDEAPSRIAGYWCIYTP